MATGYGKSSCRARSAKTNKLRAVTSASRTITIDRRASATLTASTPQVATGTSVTLAGSTSPAGPKTRVELQRLVSGTWLADDWTAINTTVGHVLSLRPGGTLWSLPVK